MMTDDKQVTPKKVEKDTSSHEEATVFSARSAVEKKPKADVVKTSEPLVSEATPEPMAPEVVSEPTKRKPPPSQAAQPPSIETPQKDNKRTVLIVVIVAIVLLCCCCAAIIAIGMATGGWESVQDILYEFSMLTLAAML